MQSVTNKLSDYMALQKPILNSQQNPEVHRLLNLLPHEHYRSGNGADFAAAYRRLTHNRQAPVQRDENRPPLRPRHRLPPHHCQ